MTPAEVRQASRPLSYFVILTYGIFGAPFADGDDNGGKSAGGGSVFVGGMPKEFVLKDGVKLPPGAVGSVPFGSGYDAPPVLRGASRRVFPFAGG